MLIEAHPLPPVKAVLCAALLWCLGIHVAGTVSTLHVDLHP